MRRTRSCTYVAVDMSIYYARKIEKKRRKKCSVRTVGTTIIYTLLHNYIGINRKDIIIERKLALVMGVEKERKTYEGYGGAAASRRRRRRRRVHFVFYVREKRRGDLMQRPPACPVNGGSLHLVGHLPETDTKCIRV